jgi:outer membrane protein OmpA-like peptidoglycan-associated protein
MKVNELHFALLLFSLSGYTSFAQNRFNSRLFSDKPSLYNSKSKVTSLHLSKFVVSVASPIDDRNKFYGEEVYNNTKVHPMDEFFQSPTTIEIQNKIKADIKQFGAGRTRAKSHDKINIATAVEVFYPKVTGFIHGKSFAKVRLALGATLNDSLLINSTYESFYITNGIDNGFEGNLEMTVEDGTNVTVGMALREALDQFYTDLNEALTPGNKKIIISGKVTNSKTGGGVRATIIFNSDSSHAINSSPDGRFKLTIPFSKHQNIQVSSLDFVTLSERLDLSSSVLRRTEKDFSLQPIEVGTIVSLRSVLFYMGTTDLLTGSYHELDGVVDFLKSNPKVKIELDGHTDNQGNANKDLVLSQQRVDKIKSYLVSKGIGTHRIQGKGFGGTRPIASNANEEGRKLNRRVEFVILNN